MKNPDKWTALMSVLIALSLGCSAAAPARATGHSRAATSGGDHTADSAERRDVRTTHHAAAPAAVTAVTADAPTATDQSETSADLEITRQIRVAIVGDSTLSWSALNCTIVTNRAVVTLRGDVGTEAERNTIERHARAVAGVVRVDDMLHVDD